MTPDTGILRAPSATRTLVRGGLYFVAAHSLFLGLALVLAVGG